MKAKVKVKSKPRARLNRVKFQAQPEIDDRPNLYGKTDWLDGLRERLSGVNEEKESAAHIITQFLSDRCKAEVLDELFREHSSAAARIYLGMLSKPELSRIFPVDLLLELLATKLLYAAGRDVSHVARMFEAGEYSALLLLTRGAMPPGVERLLRDFVEQDKAEANEGGASIPTVSVGGLRELDAIAGAAGIKRG